MTLVRVQTVIPRNTGLPEDATVMTHHFLKAGNAQPSQQECNNLIGAIAAAWENVTAGYSVSSLYSVAIDRGLRPLGKVYWSPTTGVNPPFVGPIHEDRWAVMSGAQTSSYLPLESAVCMTYHGNLDPLVEEVAFPPTGPAGNVRPRARARGRTFIGPLNAAAMDNTTARVPTLVINAVNAAAEDLDTNTQLVLDGFAWGVWSPTAGVFSPTTGGWCDNELDTMRSRERKPTVRTRWGTGAG